MSAVYPIAPGTVGWMLWRAEAAVGGCAWIVTRIGVTDTGAILKEADTIGFYSTLADARARAEALNLPGA